MQEFPEYNTENEQWYVLHCKPRQEQSVVDHLSALGVFAYFPRAEQVRFYGKRKVKRELPLFPGYVFLYGQREHAYSVDRARGLVQILEPPDPEQLAWELTNIRLAVERQAPMVECAGLAVGSRVEVRSGPFKGMQGLVEANKTHDRIILQVAMLGRAMSVEIDASILDRLDDVANPVN